jgi:hypothetical protein
VLHAARASRDIILIARVLTRARAALHRARRSPFRAVSRRANSTRSHATRERVRAISCAPCARKDFFRSLERAGAFDARGRGRVRPPIVAHSRTVDRGVLNERPRARTAERDATARRTRRCGRRVEENALDRTDVERARESPRARRGGGLKATGAGRSICNRALKVSRERVRDGR